jgi:hypothetical protein
MGPSLVACSFHTLSLYNSRHIVMLHVLVIPLIIVLFLPTMFFLMVHSLLERLRSMWQFSVKAELNVMVLVTAGITWLQWFLEDFNISVSMSTQILSDSTGAISIARDLVKHEVTNYMLSPEIDLVNLG